MKTTIVKSCLFAMVFVLLSCCCSLGAQIFISASSDFGQCRLKEVGQSQEDETFSIIGELRGFSGFCYVEVPATKFKSELGFCALAGVGGDNGSAKVDHYVNKDGDYIFEWNGSTRATYVCMSE